MLLTEEEQQVVSIPSESAFSRAFAEFAKSGLCDRVHDSLAGNSLDSVQHPTRILIISPMRFLVVV
jgi:hypothetical protein